MDDKQVRQLLMIDKQARQSLMVDKQARQLLMVDKQAKLETLHLCFTLVLPTAVVIVSVYSFCQLVFHCHHYFISDACNTLGSRDEGDDSNNDNVDNNNNKIIQ